MNHLKLFSVATLLLVSVMRSQAEEFPTEPYVGYGSGYIASGSGKNVSSASALKSAASSGGKIIVSGKINGHAVIVPKSNTHIVGDGTAELENVSFYIGESNVTIQNIKMHLPAKADMGKPDHDGDMIHIEGDVSNIWIDHCDLSAEFDGTDKDTYDGLIDVKKGPSKITISWNYIHDAHKTNLNGYTDNDARDWQMSIHHNIFNNVGSRIPSMRGGKGAIFNNYYIKVHYTAINSRVGAEVYCEKNYFDGVGTGKEDKPLKLGEGPIGTWYSDEPGKYNAVDNYYIRCLGNQPTDQQSTTSYKPSFMNDNKTVIPVMDVPKVLLEKAGVGGKTIKLKLPEGYTTTRIISPIPNVTKKKIRKTCAIYNILGAKRANRGNLPKRTANNVYITKVNGASIVKVNVFR